MRTAKIITTTLVSATISLLGCGAETSDQSDAPPMVDVDGTISTQDIGNTYGGWTQTPQLRFYISTGQSAAASILARASGPTTRGVHVCLVESTTVACTTDANCDAGANARYPEAQGTAKGYCMQNACLYRPASTFGGCAVSDNYAAVGGQGASLYMDDFYFQRNYQRIKDKGGTAAVYGCMTKAAGPSSDCGSGTDSQQIRAVGGLKIVGYSGGF